MSTTDALAFAVFDEFGKGADDRVQDHVLAAIAAERERCAALLDAEHAKRSHVDNHAAFYAALIRGQT